MWWAGGRGGGLWWLEIGSGEKGQGAGEVIVAGRGRGGGECRGVNEPGTVPDSCGIGYRA